MVYSESDYSGSGNIKCFDPDPAQIFINMLENFKKLNVNLSAVSFLPYPEQIIRDPDIGKSSGRIQPNPDSQTCKK